MSLPAVQELGLILQQTLGVLRYQGHLGLPGLSLAEEALQPPVPLPSSQGRRRQQGQIQNIAPTPPGHMAPASPGEPLAVAARAPAAVPNSLERLSLAAQRTALVGCSRCKLGRTRTSIVFGTGDQNARLMFVGAAPDRDADLQGEPFVGDAGRLLDRMIAAMGLSRQTVYIANVVKCRPPRDRSPDAEEVASCAPILRRQIAAIKPEAIVALGRFAALTLLGEDASRDAIRGAWRAFEQIPVMPTLHPAHLLHNPGDKKLVWQDLQLVMARLGLAGKHSSAALPPGSSSKR